jgi:hypothetical protein
MEALVTVVAAMIVVYEGSAVRRPHAARAQHNPALNIAAIM